MTAARPGRRALLRASLSLPFAQAARADRWPAHAVRIVVPFPPGGTSDLVSRMIGQDLSRAWGQPVVIDNKPGAGTLIGVDAVAKSAPDGYTLCTVANSFTVNQTLVKKLPYDAARELRPVASMAYSEHVLAVHPGVSAKSIAELVDHAKAHPGKLTYASFGNGTSAHLSGELLKMTAGIDLVHVPYKGQGPALADLLGGQVQLMFGNLPEFLPYIRGARLRALGLAMPKRSPFAPEIATLAEQGLAGIESTSWFGLLAPARTPDAIVAQVNADINAALETTAMKDTFAKSALIALPGNADDFARFMRVETERYAKIIRAANISLENG